jgi:AcrR family transcriptional regulator
MPKKKTSSRDRILHAATALFLKQGVAATQMQEVARRADVNQSLIGYYFPSMDGLFAEVIQAMTLEFNAYVLDQVAKAGQDVERSLEIYTRSFYAWIDENPREARLLIYFFHLATLRDPFTSMNESFRRLGRERLSSFVHQGSAEGRFRKLSAGEGQSLALQIQGSILGGVLICLSERGVSPADQGEGAWRSIRAWLLPVR